MPKAKPVFITNPVLGGSDHTTLSRAERYVSEGRARFLPCKDPSHKILQFIWDDHRYQSAASLAIIKRSGQNEGYEGVKRVLTLSEIRQIPCAQPNRALTVSQRPRLTLRKHGKVKILVQQPKLANGATALSAREDFKGAGHYENA